MRAAFALGPGASRTVTFLIAWHFPNFPYWRSCDPTSDDCRTPQNATWKNWYATRWSDAWEVIEYVARDFERLRSATCDFHDALFSSTLPMHVLDAVSANISILKSPTCLRLPDGTLYAFEGCGDTAGCCEGSCTHVWNYAQAHAYLFPSLARSQREADYRRAHRRDGFGQFRLPLPPGTKGDFEHLPAADGQMGAVVQVYREWLVSGDTRWLKDVWPAARRSLEFAWKYWDADRDGVMEGLQHNTYDVEYYGPNTMCGSLYLGALRAGEEMARIVGDDEAADGYARLFKKGSDWTDQNLFNDRFYVQDVRPEAAENWPARYRKQAAGRGMDDRFDWPRYQVGGGCLSDQLIGQWYATMLGLGYLYKRANVRKALLSIFKHNWRKDLHDHPALFRLYAFGREAGLIVCTWPDGGRPGYPSMYADEVWCGVEYQVASHMMYEGFVDEGLSIVKGVRDRHRGDRRNPWDEFECGHHYARSMASWGLLLALSGFSCNVARGRMGFAPRIFEEDFRTFWSTGSAWGVYSQKRAGGRWTLCVEVKRGGLILGVLDVAAGGMGGADVSARVGSRRIEAVCKRRRGGCEVVFPKHIELAAGERLRVVLK